MWGSPQPHPGRRWHLHTVLIPPELGNLENLVVVLLSFRFCEGEEVAIYFEGCGKIERISNVDMADDSGRSNDTSGWQREGKRVQTAQRPSSKCNNLRKYPPNAPAALHPPCPPRSGKYSTTRQEDVQLCWSDSSRSVKRAYAKRQPHGRLGFPRLRIRYAW